MNQQRLVHRRQVAHVSRRYQAHAEPVAIMSLLVSDGAVFQQPAAHRSLDYFPADIGGLETC